MQKLIPMLILSCLCIIWGTIFYFIMKALTLSVKSLSWPTTEGEVIASEVLQANPGDTGMLVNKHMVVIRYSYMVDGVPYVSDVISFGELLFQFLNKGLRSKRGAEYLSSKYPVGSAVTVYYRSGNPKQSVLQPGVLDANLMLILMIFGIVGLLLIGPLFLYMVL
jgi:hypothetical protein